MTPLYTPLPNYAGQTFALSAGIFLFGIYFISLMPRVEFLSFGQSSVIVNEQQGALPYLTLSPSTSSSLLSDIFPDADKCQAFGS